MTTEGGETLPLQADPAGHGATREGLGYLRVTAVNGAQMPVRRCQGRMRELRSRFLTAALVAGPAGASV